MGDKIRQSAKGRVCALRLPGCSMDKGETVFGHAPSVDNGMGIKQAPDFWGAYACQHCHDVVDSRVPTTELRILILERWIAGIYETQKQLIADGLITFNDS